MPYVKTDDGASIYVEVEEPENAPVLMLSNSLGTTRHKWENKALSSTLGATRK